MPTIAKANRAALWSLSLFVLPLLVGCSGGSGSESLSDGLGSTNGAPSASPSTRTEGESPAEPMQAACATPAEGCPCAHANAVTACPGPKIRTGDFTSCAPGERVCSNGVWGECLTTTVVQSADSVTQDYTSPCPSGTRVQWGALTLDGLTPSDSRIVVHIQTADSSEGLDGAPSLTLDQFRGSTNSSWTSPDAQGALAAGGSASGNYLRVTLTLSPSSQGGSTPTVAGWHEASSCVADL